MNIQRRSAGGTVALIVTVAGLALLGLGPSVMAQDAAAEENVLPAGKLGLGLQWTGSVCCISVRLWTTGVQGFEVDVEAERLLFLSARWLSKFSDAAVVDGYSGAGLTFVLGATPPLMRTFPLQTLQVLIGLEITPPPLPQLAVNIEGALEFHLEREFFTFIGAGVHFYF